MIDGIINVDKPPKLTSFAVVSLVKRLSRQKKAGHGGTLDPMASGVLLVLLGRATRIAEYLLGSRKTYRAVVELGVTTDSYDLDGEVTGRKDFTGITLRSVTQALERFKGEVWQTPPMFSALRHGGKHLYDFARRGEEVERQPRPRQVYRLELVGFEPPFLSLELECQGGFYVRSLAHDLGQELGCGGYLKELCRTRSGSFGIATSWSLEKLREAFISGEWAPAVSPIDAALADMEALSLGEEDRASFLSGRTISVEMEAVSVDSSGILVRSYSREGDFLGVGWLDRKNRILYPKKVLFRPPETKI